MRKIYLTLLLLSSLLLSNAQSKINMEGLRLLREYKLKHDEMLVSSNISKNSCSNNAQSERIATIVALNDGATIADLEAHGGEVLKQREHLAIVSLPIDKIEEFAKIDAVKRVEFGTRMYAKLDKARNATNTDWAHKGIMVDHAYTGEGVVVGIMDEGIDPNHVAFMNSDQTASRVKRVWTFMGQDGSYNTYDTPSEIASFTTETKESTHGTHVAGILAGGYEANQNIPYYGVAKGADIAMSAGLLYSNNIIYGIENIIEYAQSEGMPAVVNLSIGTNIGSHDGTDLFSQYLEILGKEAIICVSAGNEGELNIVLHKTLSETDNKIKTFVIENVYSGMHTGTIDMWGDTDKAFSVTPMVYDVVADTVVYKFPTISNSTVIEGTNEIAWYYVANGFYYEPSTDIYDDNFNKAFYGSSGSYIGVSASVDVNNNRYNAQVEYYLENATTNTGNYVMALEIQGDVGQQIYAYGDGMYSEFSSKNLAGWDDATADGTISNMACAKNVIAVGSFNSRAYGTEIEKEVSLFSSYGTLIDGRKLPHICAPGCMVFSSMSSAHAKYMGYTLNNSVIKTTINGTTHYWIGMAGSSMSSPFMAGAVALWMEANPSLEYDDILKIAQESATKDSYVTHSMVPVKWGAGKLNVIEGLKLAIDSKAGINDVITEEKRLIVTSNGNNQYEIFVAGEDKLNAVLFNMSGQLVLNVSSQGETMMIDTSNIKKGVYVLSVQGETTHYTKRILVK